MALIIAVPVLVADRSPERRDRQVGQPLTSASRGVDLAHVEYVHIDHRRLVREVDSGLVPGVIATTLAIRVITPSPHVGQRHGHHSGVDVLCAARSLPRSSATFDFTISAG